MTRKSRATEPSRRRWFWFCVPLLLISISSAGEPPQGPQKPDITSVVKVVNVPATVRNKKGEIVRSLTKVDFMLDEDDHPQTIKYFVHDNDLPLALGLLVDTSRSQRTVLSAERTASYSFLDHMLREDKDKAFVLHFDDEVELLQDLTPSRKKLESALQLLDTSEEDGGSSGSGRGSHEHGGTLLYDAVYLASNELMQKQQGRKAVIVLSDGVDRGSKETLESAIEAAQRSDTLVYSIFFVGEQEHHGGGGGFGGPRIGMGGGYPGGGYPGGGGGYPGGGGGYPGGGGHQREEESRPDGKKILTQISKETGGRLFEVSKKLPVDQIYAQIEEELRNQYILGYSPEGMDAALGYHRLNLATKQKDLTVQARDGFYADR